MWYNYKRIKRRKGNDFLNKNIKDFNLDELKKEFENIGEKPYRASQVYEWIYKKKINSFDEMTNISLELREKLKANFNLGLFKIVKNLFLKMEQRNIYLI